MRGARGAPASEEAAEQPGVASGRGEAASVDNAAAGRPRGMTPWTRPRVRERGSGGRRRGRGLGTTVERGDVASVDEAAVGRRGDVAVDATDETT